MGAVDDEVWRDRANQWKARALSLEKALTEERRAHSKTQDALVKLASTPPTVVTTPVADIVEAVGRIINPVIPESAGRDSYQARETQYDIPEQGLREEYLPDVEFDKWLETQGGPEAITRSGWFNPAQTSTMPDATRKP